MQIYATTTYNTIVFIRNLFSFTSFFISFTYLQGQLPEIKVSDFLEKRYPNWEYIEKMQYIDLVPNPKSKLGTLTDILAGQNKYIFNSKLKSKDLLSQLNYILKNNDILSDYKITDDGQINSIIRAEIVSDFNSIFAGFVYNKKSWSKINIKVKDYFYQIEIENFSVGKDEMQRTNYKNILKENDKDYSYGAYGSFIKKELQQDWNSTFADFNIKFKKLNERINESNEF